MFFSLSSSLPKKTSVRVFIRDSLLITKRRFFSPELHAKSGLYSLLFFLCSNKAKMHLLITKCSSLFSFHERSISTVLIPCNLLAGKKKSLYGNTGKSTLHTRRKEIGEKRERENGRELLCDYPEATISLIFHPKKLFLPRVK